MFDMGTCIAIQQISISEEAATTYIYIYTHMYICVYIEREGGKTL